MVELIDIYRSLKAFGYSKFSQFILWLHKLGTTVDAFVAGFGLNADYLAQVGHFSVSYGLVLTSYVLGWCFGFWYAGIITGLVIGGPWVVWKEMYRDTKPPESQPFAWPGGLKDATFYWLGILTATGMAAAIGMAFPR